MISHGSARRESGFSLLRVLVAFVIMSLSLGVLIQAFSTGLRNTSLAQDYTLAVLHAESLLARLGVEEPLEQAVELDGEIDDRFEWHAVVEEYFWEEDDHAFAEAEALITAIPYRLLVTVSWAGVGDRRREVTLETLRLIAPDDV